MKRRLLTQVLLLGLVGAPAFAADPLPAMQETPSLMEQVKSGALPPVDKRIPQQPQIVKRFAGGDGPGKHGGQLNMLISGARDTRLMTVYSYTRLIVYDDKFKLHPDILESYEVKEGREFTLKLRAGHKWSDGHPFTTEDFRFFWEDVANNSELSPSGPSVELLVDGKPPKVEIIDERTIRYSWDKPNPYFIESQARAAPLFLFRPAHYLKKLHGKYTPEEEILKLYKGSSWVNIYRRQDVMYGNSNVDMPTLNPWVLTTVPPAQRFVFVRNPYYHRIDQKGQQLPYIDDVIMTVAATNLIPAKAGLGEADLQPRYLNMRDYTFLQKSAKTSGVNVHLWESGSGSQIALYPNLTASDEEWRKLMRDVRFRRALSLAIDREELNQVRLPGPGQTLQQHDHGALGAVQARIRDQVGEIRSKAREQAPRRGWPEQAWLRRHPPAARRSTGNHRGRACERGDRGHGCPAADQRVLEEGRHQDADQTADPSRISG